MLKNKAALWIALGAILLIAIVAIGVTKQMNSRVMAVQLAKVRVEDITSTVRAPGKIEPRTQVKISADIMGKITHLLVKEGDRVRKGQLMLQLDDTQYRSAYEQSRTMVAAGEARVREAQTALRVNEAVFSRSKALFDQKLLSQAEWDQATNVHEAAKVAVATAQEEAARARAAQKGAADNLAKCRFLAPFDGVVSALNVEQGEIVITGTMNNPGTQILIVSDLSRMLVRADVDETDVIAMRLGQKARIKVDAFPDSSFQGTVLEIGNTAKRSITSTVEGQTNFEVKVVFDADVPEIRPGMTADVEIATATHTKTQVVPVQAVVIRTQRDLDRASHHGGKAARTRKPSLTAEEDTVGRKDVEVPGVFVVRDGVAHFVPVKVGLASETMIEVSGDLKENDLVVAGPYKALRELKPEGKVKKEQAGGKERK